MIDYHVHTKYSGDSSAEIGGQLAAAAARGIADICFTDHVDFDNPGGNFEPADLAARHEELKKYGGTYSVALKTAGGLVTRGPVIIREGAEISMARDPFCLKKTLAYLAPHELDFIIGSVHCVDRNDVYYPEYHAGKTKAEAYLPYLETIADCLPKYDFISVLGHYDFVAKCAPYEDRSMSADLSPAIRDAFERIFKTVVSMGKGIEINTAAWRSAPHWGLDVLSLYRRCGGEFITFGSDAHRDSAVANRLDEARELALEAGIPYYATFERMKPTLHRIK
ncbi:MAG: histidinol-phosphatase HisJ family protein [Clostridia bacterium]|nr:histidinol-phosphatase HisJ family protein [Clostridia bacterium]